MSKTKKTKYPQLKINFKNKTAHVVFGLIIICTSIVLFLSFVSYLFYWKQDFDLVRLNSKELLVNQNLVVQNLLGKIGASLSHYFIYKHFGIASLLVPVILAITGIQIFTQQYILKLKRLLTNSLFLCVWISTFLGMTFSTSSILGGYNGLISSSYLINIIGLTGTTLILSFSMIIFLSIYYKWTPEKIKPQDLNENLY